MNKWHDYPDAQIRTRPQARAFADGFGADWSFADLDRAISELSDILLASGVRPCDRVMLVLENCCAAVAALFACSRIGACVVPVNARQTAQNALQPVRQAFKRRPPNTWKISISFMTFCWW